MIFLLGYAGIGIALGLVLYVAELCAHKKYPDDERITIAIKFIEEHPLKYMFYSATIWPLYIKWFFS